MLGGHDAQQNEALVKKHLGQHDLYVHADVHGASSVVIKNPGTGPIPPLTIQQAGTMCVCRSSAWKGKVQVESYWVHAEQVSKTAPSGMFLTVGSFMIRGKKNFIPRSPMVMGLAVLFRLEDECIAAHKGERKVRGAEGEEEAEVNEAKENKKGQRDAEVNEEEEEEEDEEEAGEKENAEGKREEEDEDFDVTSAMVKGLSLRDKKVVLSEMSSDADSEWEREGGKGTTDHSESAKPKKRMSAAEKRRMKKSMEKGGAGATATQTDPLTVADAAVDPLNDAGDAEGVPEGKTADVDTLEATVDNADGSDEDERSRAGKKKGKSRGKKSTATASDEKRNGGGGSGGDKSTPAAAPLSRGARHKKKKMERYANQDEEDLLIAASVLGLQNVGKKKKEIQQRERQLQPNAATAEASDHADGEAEEDEDEEKATTTTPHTAGKKKGAAAEDEDMGDRVCFNCKQRGHLFKHCPLKPQSTSTSTASSADAAAAPGLTFSAARRAAQTEEELEIARLQEEENIGDASAVDNTPLGLIDTLTATPFEEDRLQFAVAVCAPYSALSSYRFKAKLVPGTQKKGVLCAAALNVWSRQPGVREAEKEMLRMMREEEMMAVLLSNTKLSAGLAGEAGEKAASE